MTTFAPAFKNGALDEWLSLRSAKPSTAVRIRQAPLKERKQKADGVFHQPFTFSFNHCHYP